MSEKDPETGPRLEKQAVSWHKSERFRFVLFVVATLLAAAAVLFVGRSKTLPIEDPLQKIEARLRQKHRTKWLRELRAACERFTCDCAAKAATLALDVDTGGPVRDIVLAARACPDKTKFEGFDVEALLRIDREAEAMVNSRDVTRKDPRNPNALYTQARANYRGDRPDVALDLAEKAVQAGRGTPARILLGLVAIQKGDFERARRAFKEILAVEPDDVDALYNLGVVAQRQERYGEARSSYLRVTRLDPKHVDSRYNLGILAHSIGADEEARHHLEKLRSMAPKSQRVRDLEAALAAPAPSLPRHVLSIGTDGKPAP